MINVFFYPLTNTYDKHNVCQHAMNVRPQTVIRIFKYPHEIPDFNIGKYGGRTLVFGICDGVHYTPCLLYMKIPCVNVNTEIKT